MQAEVPYNLKFSILVLVTYFFFINIVSIVLGIQEKYQKEEDDEELETTSYEDSIMLFNLSLCMIFIEYF